MSNKLGPRFGDEIIAAGLGGLPFGWQDDGTILDRDKLTREQSAVLDTVIAAHDPTKPSLWAERLMNFAYDPDRQELLARLNAAQTPEQVKEYVETTVTDLESAKVLLARILLALANIIR